MQAAGGDGQVPHLPVQPGHPGLLAARPASAIPVRPGDTSCLSLWVAVAEQGDQQP